MPNIHFYNVTFRDKRLVGWQKASKKEYVFKSTKAHQIDDIVVCDSSIGYSLARITEEVSEPDIINMASAWIVGEMDSDLLDERARIEKATENILSDLLCL